jgi:hypothetical protein
MLKFVLAVNTTNYPVVYTACGDTEKIINFKKLGNQLGVVVMDKWDIMLEDDKKYVGILPFDQLAILDFLILMHAQYFWGLAGSSFSHTLAVWRHVEQFNNFHFKNADIQQRLTGQPKMIDTFVDIFW